MGYATDRECLLLESCKLQRCLKKAAWMFFAASRNNCSTPSMVLVRPPLYATFYMPINQYMD